MNKPVYKKKKVPCEVCRDQKKKCNGQQPCERCERLNIDCRYKNIRSPCDVEYIELARQADLISEVNVLNEQIDEMQTMMSELKSSNFSPSTPSLSEDSDMLSVSDYSNLNLQYPLLDDRMKAYSLFSSDEHNVYAHLINTKDARKKAEDTSVTPWTLTLRKGQICIETKVKNYSDLLNNLYNMLSAAELSNHVPSLFNRFTQRNALVDQLHFIVHKKYGSVHCKNVARSIHIFMAPSYVNTMILATPPDSIQTTTIKLIRAYFRCLHLQHLAIHARTFMRLFVENDHVAATSPATMALCAAICTMRCKHIAECLPSISLVEYGNFYFERAHALVSDMFDECNLTTLTTYTFMMSYKIAISQHKEARMYFDLADRMATVLAPRYATFPKDDMSKQGEAVHFSRLRNYLHRVKTYQQVTTAYNPSLDNSIKRNDLVFCTLANRSEGRWDVSDDDSLQEKWFAKMHALVIHLQRLQFDALQTIQSLDLAHSIQHLCHQVEMVLRHWYSKVIPTEFRLSLPLFDSTISPSEFFTTLERECAHSAIPALTTLAVYEEWLTLAQICLPKKISAPGESWSDLPKIWKGGKEAICPVSKKWEARIKKLNDIRAILDFDGTDEEFYKLACDMFSPESDRRLESGMVLKSLHAAFNTIQLIQFLRSRSTDCYFDIRYLINAWELFLRVLRLRTELEPEVRELVPKVREYLNLCIQIVQEELLLQPYQGMMGDYAARMENDLKGEVEDEEEEMCECGSCPDI